MGTDSYQVAIYFLAIPLELVLWPLSAMENPDDRRHLQLASADYLGYHC